MFSLKRKTQHSTALLTPRHFFFSQYYLPRNKRSYMLLLGEKKIKFPQAQPWISTLKPNGVRMQRSNHGTAHHPARLTNNSAPLGFPEAKRVPLRDL